MVTNYVVSCAKATSGSSSSCKTVSTSVKRGCSISATTTTKSSAASCPTIKLDPNEDQGEDGVQKTSTSIKASSTKSSTSTKASLTRSSTTKASSSTKSSTTKPPASSVPKPPLSPPKPSPSTYHEPPLPIYTFAVGLLRDGRFSKLAIYFDKYVEDREWVCRDDEAIWEQEEFELHVPSYPVEIGPFDAQPWTDCAYRRESEKTDGVLTCVGNRYRQDGKCRAVDNGNLIDCGKAAENKPILWITEQVCTMEGGLGGGEVNPPTGPSYCYNATFNGEPSTGTVTTINKELMKALIIDSCDAANGWKFEVNKDLRGNPSIRLEMISNVQEGTKPKWDKQDCKDMFEQLNFECESRVHPSLLRSIKAFRGCKVCKPLLTHKCIKTGGLYGGIKTSNDVIMSLAAYDKLPPPPPPAPPLIASPQPDECFNATWAAGVMDGSGVEGYDGKVLTRPVDGALMRTYIHETCDDKAGDEAIDEQKNLPMPDDKSLDGTLLHLYSAKDPKDAKVKWDKRDCGDRFMQVLVDCECFPYRGPPREGSRNRPPFLSFFQELFRLTLCTKSRP
ncbi:MAG: hypothetical protein LQ345_005939 [Seirophora villosa]|nr:MAG: hypothetical protein LQ345_005939 [Seirophora villosa]